MKSCVRVRDGRIRDKIFQECLAILKLFYPNIKRQFILRDQCFENDYINDLKSGRLLAFILFTVDHRHILYLGHRRLSNC